MRYKAEYDEYSETNKFLDELFQEDCEFEWQSDRPTSTSNALNITVVKPEGAAEETYLAELASEIGEKISEIIDKSKSLPSERDRGVFLTKEELISRLISVSNTLDQLNLEIEEACGTTVRQTTIIGGGCPFANIM
jgi:hypothetical protein